ncbi:MAG: indole-3-glycerol phosphate synthase TrpC [Lachnospiraceae bacterium]|nr:indole-3-glycerol phosphate synthase TrpC [Lachnospiraceae bacterium]
MILDEIVKDKKIRLREHKAAYPMSEAVRDVEAMLKDPERNNDLFYNNLSKPGISIIGEFKKASPSLGKIDSSIDLTERIDEYNESVDAISVLTEEDHFNGNIEYLRTVRSISSLPILRKDFMIDEYQFYEAKAIGADAVLLITAILDDAQMKAFYDLARQLKMGVLVETHDEYEIERALAIDPRIIGVNNRNLNDFSIDIKNTGKLAKYIPEDKVFVAESGIMNDRDVAYLNEVGVDGFLIGRAFMESPNPRQLALRWKSLQKERMS